MKIKMVEVMLPSTGDHVQLAGISGWEQISQRLRVITVTYF